MVRFYVGKVMELIGLTSLGAGLIIGVGNHTGLAAPIGQMSGEKAMGYELLLFIAGMIVFGIGRWIERGSD